MSYQNLLFLIVWRQYSMIIMNSFEIRQIWIHSPALLLKRHMSFSKLISPSKLLHLKRNGDKLVPRSIAWILNPALLYISYVNLDR